MTGKSPTARTLAYCREHGIEADVVERWLPYAKVRKDLFGGIDLILLEPGRGVLGVQATDGTNHAKRRAKLCAEPRMRAWLEAGAHLEVWSWALHGARGKKKLWELRRDRILAEDLCAPGSGWLQPGSTPTPAQD